MKHGTIGGYGNHKCRCTLCCDAKREYDRKYRASNREKLQEYQAARREVNNERRRQYRKERPVETAEYNRRYREENAERIRETSSRYRAENWDALRSQRLQYVELNRESLDSRRSARDIAIRERATRRGEAWTEAEDQVCLDSDDLSNSELAIVLGRTRSAVVRRRVFLRNPAGKGEPKHGTTSGYWDGKCRCDECRDAVRRYNAANRAANLEKRLEYDRAYRIATREKQREYKRRYEKDNAEKVAERRRGHRDRIAEHAARSGQFSSEEDLLILSDLPVAEIALTLQRTYSSVQGRRRRLRKLAQQD